MRFLMVLFVMAISGCGYASSIDLTSLNVDWLWKVLVGVLGQFPDLNGWLVLILPLMVAILRLVRAVLQKITEGSNSGGETDSKILAFVTGLLNFLTKLVDLVIGKRSVR
jgi:hypothetical protein